MSDSSFWRGTPTEQERGPKLLRGRERQTSIAETAEHREGRRGRPVEKLLCGHCQSPRITAYSVIHENYTSKSVTWKGLIFKHGYSVMRRSSLAAERCAPPMAPTYWLPAFYGCMYGAATYLGLTARHGAISKGLHIGLVAAILYGIGMTTYQLRFYPDRVRRWRCWYLCGRCGYSTYFPMM